MENLETFESFFNKHKDEMKNNWGAWVPDNRYYYDTKEVTPKYQNNFTVGIEDCALKPGVMIGSENCSLCENYVRGETSFKKGKSWLICNKIDEAIK